MQKLTIDIQANKKEYVDLTQKEEAERLGQTNAGLQEAAAQKEKELTREQAIERLKVSASQEVKDLLAVLGIDTTGEIKKAAD